MKVGDTVSALDEDITGEVVKIDGDSVTIESDGFEMEFLKRELIVEKSSSLGQPLFQNTDIDEVIKQKEAEDKPFKNRPKRKDKYEHTMEVDLHAHQLPRSTKGMSKHQILNFQIDTVKHKIEFARKKNIQKVVFIHGVGEGVLKMELDYVLGNYDFLKFYDADYKKYGYGATEVYIFQNN